jgi:hypothetical protein
MKERIAALSTPPRRHTATNDALVALEFRAADGQERRPAASMISVSATEIGLTTSDFTR